jgi:UDP-glucose 4-epimerase
MRGVYGYAEMKHRINEKALPLYPDHRFDRPEQYFEKEQQTLGALVGENRRETRKSMSKFFFSSTAAAIGPISCAPTAAISSSALPAEAT